MSTDVTVTIDDVRAVGLCVNGTRVWFARHDLDFRAFLRDGCAADTLLATGDAMALRVVEHARIRLEHD
jgi:hypothetical protein